MLLKAISSTAVVAALCLAPLAGPVAPALAGHDPVEGLTEHPEWGSVAGVPGVLKRGCHTYQFSYSIDPPDGDWGLEVFITGPDSVHVAGGAFLSGYDGNSGTGTYKLCRASTRPGRFTIEAKLSVDNGAPGYVEGKLPADTYKLRRQRRR